jgi:hypothetical protein
MPMCTAPKADVRGSAAETEERDGDWTEDMILAHTAKPHTQRDFQSRRACSRAAVSLRRVPLTTRAENKKVAAPRVRIVRLPPAHRAPPYVG